MRLVPAGRRSKLISPSALPHWKQPAIRFAINDSDLSTDELPMWDVHANGPDQSRRQELENSAQEEFAGVFRRISSARF